MIGRALTRLRSRRSAPGRLRPADLGRSGERFAARELRRRRYRIVARNVRRRFGEIDLIALAPDRRTVVFVEVKTRAVEPGRPAPPPEAAITRRKRQTLLHLAHDIARRRGWSGRPLRIDVVAIDWPLTGPPALRHYQNAVTAGR